MHARADTVTARGLCPDSAVPVVESIQSPPSLCQLHCKGRHTLIRSDGYGYGYGFKLGLHQSPTSLPSDDGIRSFVEPRPGFAARDGVNVN